MFVTAFVRFDGARRRLGFRVGLLISASALAGSFSGHANAQTSQAAPPPRYNNIDDLGIDLTTGQPNISFTEGSIGPANGGIAFTKTWTSGRAGRITGPAERSAERLVVSRPGMSSMAIVRRHLSSPAAASRTSRGPARCWLVPLAET
jgi:hypothetical protein